MSSPPQSLYYISITGLKVKSLFHYLLFAYHAIPTGQQAHVAPGNIHTSTNMITGIHHTLTVWQDRKAMLKFYRSGAHLKALKATPTMSSYGKVYGYESDTIPDWTQARQLWEEKGRVVHGEPNAKFGDKVVVAVTNKKAGASSSSFSASSVAVVQTVTTMSILLIAAAVVVGVGPFSQTAM